MIGEIRRLHSLTQRQQETSSMSDMAMLRQLQKEDPAERSARRSPAIGKGYSATQSRREFPHRAAAAVTLPETVTHISGRLGGAIQISVRVDHHRTIRTPPVGAAGELVQVDEDITVVGGSELVDAAVAIGAAGGGAIEIPGSVYR